MQHGGDIYRNKVKMDHSVNLNPLGIPAEVLSAVRSSLDRAGVYPDLLQGAVREEIAASVGGSSTSVLAGSGASELLMGAVRVIMPKKALLFEPCFSGYQHALASVGCEICHHILTEEKGFKRATAVFVITAFAWAVGVLCSLSFGPLAGVKLLGNSIFDFLDKLCSDWLLPIGGLLFTLFVGWKMSRADAYDEFTNGGTLKANVALFRTVWFLVRYVAPIGIVVVFLTNLIF